MRSDPNSLRYTPYHDEDDSEDEMINLSPPVAVAPPTPSLPSLISVPMVRNTGPDAYGEIIEPGHGEDNDSSFGFDAGSTQPMSALIRPFRDTSFPKRRPIVPLAPASSVSSSLQSLKLSPD